MYYIGVANGPVRILDINIHGISIGTAVDTIGFGRPSGIYYGISCYVLVVYLFLEGPKECVQPKIVSHATLSLLAILGSMVCSCISFWSGLVPSCSSISSSIGVKTWTHLQLIPLDHHQVPTLLAFCLDVALSLTIQPTHLASLQRPS